MIKKENTLHNFHIPVMGTGYTADSPIKIAHYGISSVVPLADHYLLEQLREMYSKQYNKDFIPEDLSKPEGRALCIQKYLDLTHELVGEKFEALKNSDFETEDSQITKYFQLLPDTSAVKVAYLNMLEKKGEDRKLLQAELREMIRPGNIDVNIMTKLDGVNFDEHSEPLPTEYNDAHAALKGFANSKVKASVVLSAGLNPRLYGYMATFAGFFPNKSGELTKRIVLKVSDYRSAMVQGRFLAKKGLWVSEFRIESGLNCGGHAFASDGFLLGPILKEFNDNRTKLADMLFATYADALKQKGIHVEHPYPIHYTVQGGVGDAHEQKMFIDHYQMESVGWGSPFMLVPEATTVDDFTLNLLKEGKEEDFYLSDISPLGVPFNSIKGNWADTEKQKRIEAGKPGASCLKKFLAFNTEFTKYPICTASVQYQKTKIKELKNSILNPEELKQKIDKLVEKACLCVGLGNSVIDKYKLDMPKGNHGVVVCPGPNLAYFNKISSLSEMVDFIYNKTQSLFNSKRPNVFVKELKIYMDYLQNKMSQCKDEYSSAEIKYFTTFKSNLQDGISYYKDLFSKGDGIFNDMKERVLSDLESYKAELEAILLPQVAK